MFTGIITDIGTITELEQRGDLRARIDSGYQAAGIDIGASIACDGVCLTVIARSASENGAWFDVEVSAETVSKTNLADWQEGSRVNLERALKVGDELGGHIVSGHVDGVAKVISMTPEGDSTRVGFEAPAELARFIAPKGSVALNGTSLTVNEVEGNSFGINMIPHTQAVTAFSALSNIEISEARPAPINLEIDQLARYVHRQLQFLPQTKGS